MIGDLIAIENILNEFSNPITIPKEKTFSTSAQFFHLNR
jgi:hypothetical protein